MLNTKYQSSNPRRKILKLVFFVPMFQLVTPWAGPVLTPRASYDKLGRSPQGDAKSQISKLYAFQFLSRRILKMGFFIPIFQLETPVAGPILTPGASPKQNW